MTGQGSLLRITVVAGDGRRDLTAASEREVAHMAESVLHGLAGEPRARAVWVRIEGADVGAQERLAAYLAGVALELGLHWS